jgi:hypothetical protein
VTTSPHREPTNDQLWAQPPADAAPTQPGQAVAPYTPPTPVAAPAPADQSNVRPDRTQYVLAMVSLGMSIPLTGIAAGIGGLPGLVIVWVGIVLLNFVYGWTHRRP